MAYAEKTGVSPERSRTEIEQTLKRYGAEAFSYGVEGNSAVVIFRANERYVKFTVDVPSLESDEVRWVASGTRQRNMTERRNKQAQIERQRWRALLLVIKAKLEAIDSGIENFEQAFLPQIMLPDRTTVGDSAIPVIAEAYESGQMPTSILPGARPELTA